MRHYLEKTLMGNSLRMWIAGKDHTTLVKFKKAKGQVEVILTLSFPPTYHPWEQRKIKTATEQQVAIFQQALENHYKNLMSV